MQPEQQCRQIGEWLDPCHPPLVRARCFKAAFIYVFAC